MSRKLSFFMARRYFASKKSRLVTAIAVVAMVSIGVATAAMVVVLSVMNGMNRFVAERFWVVDSDLKIESAEGKFFRSTEILEKAAAVEGVAHISAVLKDQAVLSYGAQNCMIYLQGVDENFAGVSEVAGNVFSGEYNLQDNLQEDSPAALVLMGGGVYEQMQIPPVYTEENAGACRLYAVDGKALNSPLGLQQAVSSYPVYASGLFSSIPEYDNHYVFSTLDFARYVFKTAPDAVSSLEIKLAEGASLNKVKKSLKAAAGADFTVKDRIEQQSSMFKSMRAEKLIIMAVFAFIMLIATFTMVADQMLLMYEKRPDSAVLASMGMTEPDRKRIFFYNGLLVNLCGTLGGLLTGSLIAFGQQHYGWVKLGGGNGNYITDAYPVFWQFSDVAAVLVIGLVIGVVASAIPLKQINNSYERE